jgi:hypothetical protein
MICTTKHQVADPCKTAKFVNSYFRLLLSLCIDVNGGVQIYVACVVPLASVERVYVLRDSLRKS